MTAFTFANGGFQQTRMHPRQRARAPENAEPSSLLSQLAPMLILVLFSLVSFLPSLLNPPIEPPPFSFSPSPPVYTDERLTTRFEVPYYVNPGQFARHPIWESIPVGQKANPKAGRWSADLRRFEEQEVELGYVRLLDGRCRAEQEVRRSAVDRNRGFFGLGADWEEIRRLERTKLESCERLKRFHHLV